MTLNEFKAACSKTQYEIILSILTAKHIDYDRAQEYLYYDKNIVNYISSDFKSLLHSLCQINDIDPLFLEEYLKAARRDIINQYDNQYNTALHLAVKKRPCNINTIELLLKYGADPSLFDKHNLSSLDYISSQLKITTKETTSYQNILSMMIDSVNSSLRKPRSLPTLQYLVTKHASQKLAYNLYIAYNASSYVSSINTIGAPNNLKHDKITSGYASAIGKLMHSELIQWIHNKDQYTSIIPAMFKMAQLLKEYRGGGTCFYQTSLAFYYLLGQKNQNKLKCRFEYFNMDGGSHHFIVVDRLAHSCITDPSSWGNHAVICDPWAKHVFPASEYNQPREWFDITIGKPELWFNDDDALALFYHHESSLNSDKRHMRHSINQRKKLNNQILKTAFIRKYKKRLQSERFKFFRKSRISENTPIEDIFSHARHDRTLLKARNRSYHVFRDLGYF